MKKSFKDKSISIAIKKISVRIGVSDEENAQIKGGTQMKKLVVIMVVALLLAGCAVGSPAPVDTSPAETQDIDAIVQQSVDEAIAQYEAEQKEKDAEIERLKAQLEELTPQEEEDPDNADNPLEDAPAEETPQDDGATVQEEPSAEPEPQPEEPVSSQPAAKSSSYDGFDLKNLYPAYIWENFEPTEGDSSSDEGVVYGDDGKPQNPTGFVREDDGWAVVQLINEERENHGLEALPADDDLMELAAVRAVELWEDQYSHTRPDGTTVGDLRCGENIGRRYSAEEQVESWMNSEGHRKNNLSERYHHIGAACYQAKNGNLYWVAVFSLD